METAHVDRCMWEEPGTRQSFPFPELAVPALPDLRSSCKLFLPISVPKKQPIDPQQTLAILCPKQQGQMAFPWGNSETMTI